MKILFVGAGGVGGYFGARLFKAGADVTYLLREQRHQKIQSEGLIIETPKETFTIRPKTITKDQLTPIYDLIILAPKAFDLDSALDSIRLASSHGVILPLLNGLSHLRDLDEKFGTDRVMGGVAHIAAMLTDAGAVRQLTDLHALTVGPRSAAHASLAKEFYTLCETAGFDHTYSENIEQSLWDKWIFLATLAGMTTLCRGTVGDIVASTWGTEIMRKFFAECCAVAEAQGFPMKESARNRSLDQLTKQGSTFTASMLRDLRSGKMTEHSHILGEMIQRGMDKGIACDLLKVAHTHLVVEQSHRE